MAFDTVALCILEAELKLGNLLIECSSFKFTGFDTNKTCITTIISLSLVRITRRDYGDSLLPVDCHIFFSKMRYDWSD